MFRPYGNIRQFTRLPMDSPGDAPCLEWALSTHRDICEAHSGVTFTRAGTEQALKYVSILRMKVNGRCILLIAVEKTFPSYYNL